MTAHRTRGPSNSTEPRVAIIGCGFSGIAAAVALQRRGIHNYVIFESCDGVGGTWWKNRYPGAEVDLESHIYSFSFAPSDWSRTHASWQELQGYLEAVVDRFAIRSHLRFGSKVREVAWDERSHGYHLTLDSGPVDGLFTAVISAVGFLNVPAIPPFARDDAGYRGVLCHTSAWPEGTDLSGKKVGVLGTGSSGVQVIAAAAAVAESVSIFQNEPNWVLPKGSRDFSAGERRWNRLPLVRRWHRWRLYVSYDFRQMRTSHARLGGLHNRRRQKAAEDFLDRCLSARPELRSLVTPQFAVEARRTVISDDYYPSLLRPNVRLVPHRVKGMTPTGVIDANGDEHELDVVVMATGFDAANYLAEFRVIGAGGSELHEVWAGEPSALLGLMVPDFPNFFMMYGPNTNAIPLVTFYEQQARFAARTIEELSRSGRTEVRVSRPITICFNEWLQSRLSRTVWATTHNYFQARTGRIVSQWPFSASLYIALLRAARRIALRYR